MKKKAFYCLLLFSALLLSLFLFSGCKKDGGDAPHKHSYADTYASNDEVHYYPATCGHDTKIKGEEKHTWDEGRLTEEWSCDKSGKFSITCTVCGHVKNVEIPAAHTYRNGACTVCTEKEPLYQRVDKSGQPDEKGQYILFGQYPQSKLPIYIKEAELNALAGELPTEADAKGWTSYLYYSNGLTDKSYMWYQDISYKTDVYRGVYFATYRPKQTIAETFDDAYDTQMRESGQQSGTANQKTNGYTAGKIYWFKFEPIKWRIIEEKDGVLSLSSHVMLDSREFNTMKLTADPDGNSQDTNVNNYATSTIREWLNDTFYNTAFFDLQKDLIELTLVDNSFESTQNKNDLYTCEDTEDRIYLLCHRDILSSELGFSANLYDSLRQRGCTDYARCQGLKTIANSSLTVQSWWWLRSPYSEKGSVYTRCVGGNGCSENFTIAYNTGGGVCPALRLRLQ